MIYTMEKYRTKSIHELVAHGYTYNSCVVLKAVLE